MMRPLASLVFLFSSASLASLDDRIQVVIEEPVNFGTYAGISNLRGYAVSPEGIGNFNHQVFIDGEFAFYLGTYGERADVGAAFPSYPGSGTGGFSMAFNYKSLSPGQHHVRVVAYDNAGNFNDATTTFTVQKFESEFIAEDSAIDISGNDDIEVLDGQGLRIRGARIEGKEWDFTLRWDKASQGFKTEDISASGWPSFCPQPGNPACNTTGSPTGGDGSDGSSDTSSPTPADCSVMDGRYSIQTPGIIMQNCSGDRDVCFGDYASNLLSWDHHRPLSDIPDKYYDIETDSCASITIRPVESLGSPTLTGYAWAAGLEVVKLSLTSDASAEFFKDNVGCMGRQNGSVCGDNYAKFSEPPWEEPPWNDEPTIENFWYGNNFESISDCQFIPPNVSSNSEANTFDVIVDRQTDAEGEYSIYVSYDVCLVGYFKTVGYYGNYGEESDFTALLRYRYRLCPYINGERDWACWAAEGSYLD